MHLAVSHSELANFLVSAKRRTYAAGGSDSETAVLPQLLGSHQLEHRSGDFFYRDIYFGEAQFAGQEIVCLRDTPIWAMCYAGGFTAALRDPTEAEKVGGFLQAALRQVSPERPFRGPSLLVDGEYEYADKTEGNIECFQGTEAISRGGVAVYRLHYCGGRLR